VKIDYTPKITFDDVLIAPAFSNIESREEIDIRTNFLGYRPFPIISANMNYVTGVNMAIAMQNSGAVGIINRFQNAQQIIDELDALKDYRPAPLAISVGIRDFVESLLYIDIIRPEIVCIDVAHGYHFRVEALIETIKEKFPGILVIAGNVATEDGFYSLAKVGADGIKVGIGPGSVCTTREVTGVGYPQLSAIMECAEVARQYKVTLIADGGINSSGDIVKALAAGADAVMLGKLLAGHDECPGEKIVTSDGRTFKPYQGQSMLGVNVSKYAPEGIFGYVPARGKVAETLKTLVGGIKTGFSYVGARNIQELRDNAEFVVVSNASKHENNTRVAQEVA
jgi:IMP dehydrogenase